MTTQDLRALIARLQARLDGGTQGRYYAMDISLDDEPRWVVLAEQEQPGHSIGVASCNGEADARLIAAALNELPVQIARWLARLDTADQLSGYADSTVARRNTLLATVTEDVQAWEAQIERLGEGE